MHHVCAITFKFCCHARLSRHKNAKIYTTTTRRNQRYDNLVSRISFENHEHISEDSISMDTETPCNNNLQMCQVI